MRRILRAKSFGFYSFNPRICKRCDVTFAPSTAPVDVSIHASVKDATGRYNDLYDADGFQSTHL